LLRWTHGLMFALDVYLSRNARQSGRATVQPRPR
jgi:hypothetical protein